MTNPENGYVEGFYYQDLDNGMFSVWTRNWGTTLNTSHGLASLVDWKQNEE
jgi:hypothetical protein